MKPIPRFKTDHVYANHTGKKHFKVIKRTDDFVWLVMIDKKFGDQISTVRQLKVRTLDTPTACEYTLLPKAYIKAINIIK